MLVPTMTAQEIYHELMTEFGIVKRKGIIQANFLWQQMMRKKIHHQVCTFTIKTSKLNVWNVIIQLTGEYKKTGFYLKSRDNKGSIAYAVLFLYEGEKNEERFILKYTTHFFERYNERTALGFKESIEVIKHFFKNNFDFDIGESQQLDDGTRLVHFIFKDGIGIGWKDDDIKMICLKTFIANTTLTKHQNNIAKCIKNDIAFTAYVQPRHLQNRF